MTTKIEENKKMKQQILELEKQAEVFEDKIRTLEKEIKGRTTIQKELEEELSEAKN